MAKWDLYSFSRLASGIQVPLLVPTFPRYISAYLQNLSNIVFRSDLLSSSLERIDWQLIAMIEDAQKRLETWHLYPEDRVFMTGFSASGQFTSCFAIVHSERIKAAAAGGGPPTVPVASWNGQELRYFQGIADLEELTGESFALESFVDIPLFFYIGDQDVNYTGCPGCFFQAEDIYASANANSQFKVYTDVGHWISEQGWTDLQSFFDDYPPDPSGMWVTVSGSVSYEGTPLCAMVLANGQYMFTCEAGENFGTYEFSVPLDEHGEITLFVFVSDFAPFKMSTDTSALDTDIQIQRADPQSRTPIVTTEFNPGTETLDGWTRIEGTVSLDGIPLCAMVLANGQYMFSCDANNGIYDLTVPLDSNGQITLFVFVDGLQPYEQILTP
jgi:hypothetical protein